MTLSVNIQRRFESFALDARFEAPSGITALFGRSGSGKTSVVNGVAGLLRPDAGRIEIGGRVLFDAQAKVSLPANHRNIGYVFQDGRLFPHMTVARNLAYGGTFDAGRLIALLGLEPLLDRMPEGLSGGERQRVALGRALMSNPDLILLDEPLAALDGPRKDEIYPYLERLRDELAVPMLYVSHDMAEIARLATTIVILRDGKVMRSGTLEEVLADPQSAAFMSPRDAGAVLLGRIAGYDPIDGLSRFDFDGGQLVLAGRLGQTGAPARVRIGASDVILSLGRPTGISALNILPATVTSLQTGGGSGVAVGLKTGGVRLLARITRQSVAAMGLAQGKEVFAIVKANAVAGPQTDPEQDPRAP